MSVSVNPNEIAAMYKLVFGACLRRPRAHAIIDELHHSELTLPDMPISERACLLDLLSEHESDALASSKRDFSADVEDFLGTGGGVLLKTDPHYPDKLLQCLKSDAPPLLAYKGNIDLLRERAVGFCGSRKATHRGREVALDCSEQLAAGGVVVISGNASGIDEDAHYAALRAGGRTILVLPEGIMKFRIRKRLREVWDWRRVLVLSEFSLRMPWMVQQAMQRNKTIIALSQVMVVIEARAKGGTMEAGKSALAMNKPLFAAEYGDESEETCGNELLIREGARRLRRSRDHGRAALEMLLSALNNNENELEPAKSSNCQLDLL